MSTFNTILASRKGLAPATLECDSMYVVSTADATAAAVVGAVMQLDHQWTSADTTNATPGETGSSYVNLTSPETGELPTGTYLVALEAVAKGASGSFKLKGRTQVLVNNTTGGNLDPGTLLGPANNLHYLSDAPVAGTKWVARLDETSPTADDGTTLRWCWFDGE